MTSPELIRLLSAAWVTGFMAAHKDPSPSVRKNPYWCAKCKADRNVIATLHGLTVVTCGRCFPETLNLLDFPPSNQ